MLPNHPRRPRSECAILPVALAIWLLAAVVPGVAQEEWKRGQVRDLAFEVPAAWHFIFDEKDGVGGYTPDARKARQLPIGIGVAPGKLSEIIPKDAIERTESISVDGHGARRYHVKMPADAPGRAIMVDIDEPGADGKPLAIVLTGPIAEWDAWQPILERILGSVRFEPDLSSFIIPQLEGPWYVDGRAEQEAKIVQKDRGAYFSVDESIANYDDERFDVVRLDPYHLSAVEKRAGLTGTVSPDGLQIVWSDGIAWHRTPLAGETVTQGESGEPEGTKRIALGALSAEVPESWQETESSRGPLSARYAISPRRAGLAGLVAIELAGSDGEAALSDYVAEANATLLQGGRRSAGAKVTAPWEDIARLEGVMVWGADGAQPTVMEIRAAVSEETLHILTIAWPAYADPDDIDAARRIALSAALGPEDTGSRAEDAAEQLLFDGTLGERWQPLSVAGGNFDAFARIEEGTLVVDVPEGNGWGKTGIWTSERLVKAPAGGDGAETILTFAFDPERTSDFVVALGQKDNPDEWWTHDVRIGWNRDADGKSSTLTMWVRKGEVMKTRLGPEAPAALTLRLRPGGLVVAETGTGGHVEAILPADVTADGFGIHALAHAPAGGKPAKMALRSIALTQERLGATAASGDPDRYAEEPQDIALFDGTLGARWVRHSAAGGNFEAHARLKDGGLVVDVPPDSFWGWVGILSPEPLVWLDRFGEGASATVTYRFDPDGTTGFVAALAMPGGGGDPGSPALLLYWRRTADGSGAKATLYVRPQYKEPVWEVDVPAAAPEQVKIVLSPAGVRVEGPGMPEEAAPWDVLAEGQGFRVWAYSHPDAANQPVTMALREIRLERVPGETAPEALAPGVEPLPVKVLFDGAANDIWEPAATLGGDFDRFARYEEDWLVVDVPGGNAWAKTGLLSADPVLALDERAWKAPTRFTFKLDPHRSDGLRIATASYKAAEMWPNGHDAWVTFARDPLDGSYLIGMENSPSHQWSRRVDARWIETVWDGTLTVDFGYQWAAVCLAAGPCVRGTTPLGLHVPRYMTVLASAWESGGPARMALRRIERGIVTPPAMTALERFDLVDDEDFDPEAFLQALANHLAQ